MEPAQPAHEDLRGDTDLAAVFFAFWVVSIVRAVAGIIRQETFGTEATLALLTVFLLPWLWKKRRCRLRPAT